MKALHTSMLLIVSAIAILAAALVILTVFGFGITSVATLTDLRAQCGIQGVSVCRATNSPPLTWDSPSVLVNSIMMSCRDATGCQNCQCILGIEAEDARDYEPRERIYAGDSEGRGISIELPSESIEIAMENLPGKGGGPDE